MSFFLRVFSDIFRSRTRSLLTMLGISVGVFAVVLISAISSAGTNEIEDVLSTMGVNSVLVHTDSTIADITLGSDDVTTLARFDGVNKAMPLMASSTGITLLGENTNCYAWGVSSEAREIIALEAIHGRLVSSGDIAKNAAVCVIDEDFALKSYGRSNIVGKTAKVLLGGSYHDFEIIGVAKSGLTNLQSVLTGIMPHFVYIPYTTMQAFTGRTSYDRIAVLIDDAEGTEITDLICSKMSTIKGQSGSIVTTNLLSQKQQIGDIIGIVTLILSLIAGISLFVSGLTVMTTMLVSVGERRREIGVKKAIGARKRDILSEFLLESTVLSAMGCIFGCAMALLCTFIGCMIFGIEFSVNLGAVLTVCGFSIGFGAIFGVYPAVKAASLNPIEALRQ